LRVYSRSLTVEEIRKRYNDDIASSAALQKSFASQRGKESERRMMNLALASNGAVVLTSSFADYRASYSDNVIDGDEDTAWRSWDNEMPQWVEVRWAYPVIATSVAFREIEPSHTTAFEVQAWDGTGHWRTVKQVSAVTAEDDRRVVCEFPPVTTDRLRLMVTGNDGPHTQYTEVEVSGPSQVNVGSLRPFWKGYHIWYPEPGEQVIQEPRYFRATFDLGEKEQVTSAFIQLYTNDLYEVFVNGKSVAKGFKIMGPVSVGEHARPGKNCLAIIATPTSQPGWPNMALTADLTINTDRETRYVTTDKTMKVSREATEGWMQARYDDSRWQSPFIVARVGEGVWGRLAYADRAAREQMIVEKVELPTMKNKPGTTTSVRLHLRPAQPPVNDYVLAYEAGEESVLPGNGDYTVSRGTCLPPTPTSKWPSNQTTVVEIPITVPACAPDGEVPVRVEGLNIQQGRGLDLVDAARKRLTTLGSLKVDRFGVPSPAERGRARTQRVRGVGVKPLTARVTRDAPVRAFEFDGKPMPPLVWAYENPTYEKVHLSSQTGIHLYQARGYPLQPDGTLERNQKLCLLLDQHIRSILSLDKDAKFIVMLDLRPSPLWLTQHPEARLITAFGKLGPQSYFSKEHLALVLDHLRTVIRYLQSRPYSNRIFSYDLTTCGTPDSALGGNDENLFEKDRAKLTMGDYNLQAITAFRDWLKQKYRGKAADLQAAWSDPQVTSETARVTNEQLIREGTNGGVFRDPVQNAAAADYFEFLSGGILRFIFKLGEFAKQETGGRALTGNYYGYDVAHLTGYNLPGSVQQDNNFELDAAMKSDLFDYYAMVTSYSHRLAGTHFEPQHSVASMDLHRRMYLGELDIRTLTAEVRDWGRQRSVRESVEMMKRDLAEKIMYGHAAWFADWASHGLRGVGYFVEPNLLKVIGQSRQIYQDTMKEPRPGVAEIAVFVSGKAYFHHDLYYAPPLYNNLIRRTLFEQLPHIGAPYDVYRLEDLGNEKVRKQYRLYIFINPFALNEEDQKNVDALKRDGKTLLWFYAPGYVQPGHGLSVEGIQRATGLIAAAKPGKEAMECRVLEESHPITKGIPKGTVERIEGYGEVISNQLHPTALGPVFYVDDPQATTLGTYPDGKPALAAKDFGKWKSVYSAVPYMDTALLRNIAQHAGVHLYCAPGPVVMASGSFLMIHKGYDSPDKLAVDLPAACTVVDFYAGKTWATKAKRFDLEGKGCRTFLLRLKER
ncbi:MAG: discoidin domain-containing protein, partial [Armatimonadetes bacterium]|nr:discoidin domain-containing protein [Armatimonadota bacterium]